MPSANDWFNFILGAIGGFTIGAIGALAVAFWAGRK